MVDIRLNQLLTTLEFVIHSVAVVVILVVVILVVILVAVILVVADVPFVIIIGFTMQPVKVQRTHFIVVVIMERINN
ncbi:MAG: hypothetical protein ACR2J3_13185 [Aridibacter sp.]